MKRHLIKFLLPLLLILFTPVPALHAQNGGSGDNTTVAASDGSSDESADNKKKKKDKEEDGDFFSFSIEKFNSVFFLRLAIDLLAMIILIRLIYLPVYHRRDHIFTFFMFNITIFIITNLLSAKGAGLSTGAAFGMFAVFSLLRYRTEDISARDMTYLFMVIALGLISSINKGDIIETGLVNVIILLGAFLLDGNVLFKTEFVKTIQYENIELIKPENYQLLLGDIRKRTGLNVHKVSIGRIDFLRDTATLKIYYHEAKNQEYDHNDAPPSSTE